MSLPDDIYMKTRWAMNLEQLDRQIARLAMLCQVRLLEPGVIERVLRDDPSVCGCDNAKAFARMRDLLLMHFTLLEREADAVGQQQAAAIQQYVVERLKKSFPALAEPWPAA